MQATEWESIYTLKLCNRKGNVGLCVWQLVWTKRPFRSYNSSLLRKWNNKCFWLWLSTAALTWAHHPIIIIYICIIFGHHSKYTQFNLYIFIYVLVLKTKRGLSSDASHFGPFHCCFTAISDAVHTEMPPYRTFYPSPARPSFFFVVWRLCTHPHRPNCLRLLGMFATLTHSQCTAQNKIQRLRRNLSIRIFPDLSY